MSDAHYIKIWLSTQKDLEKLIPEDRTVAEGEPIEERKEAINKILPLYYRYRRIVQRLTLCHDEIVQPQIREITRKMLDYSIVRMLEYRREIVDLTCLECPWSNDYLFNARLTPDDLDLWAPLYDTASRLADFERRRQIVNDRFNESRTGSETNDSETAIDASSKRNLKVEIVEEERREDDNDDYARERAILLIQNHERARIARRITRKAELRRDLTLKLASGQMSPKEVDPAVQAQAAKIVQRAWRNYVARREAKRRLYRVDEILGMTIPSWNPNGAMMELDEVIRVEGQEAQMRAKRRWEETVAREREKIRENRGGQMVEEARDEIREWYLQWFNELECFDAIPPAEVGGSLLLTTGLARTPAEYASAQSAASDDKGKKKGGKEDFGDGEDEEEEEEDEGWRMQESKVLPWLQRAMDEFGERWAHRADKLTKLRERGSSGLAMDVIAEDLYCELQLETRPIADQQMREEMARLNRAFAADLAADGMPFAQPKPQNFVAADDPRPKKENQEPVKAAEALKKEEEEELLLQLVDWQVLRMPISKSEAKLSEWPGAVSLALRENPECRLGDCKQPLLDYCVLPLGSRPVHGLAPLVRSVCVAGPPGSGQAFLARAICSELKAAVFDLTPEKHVGRFLKRDSQAKLIRAVTRLSRAYAPSIVLVEGESAWLKKLTPELKPVQPKRFAPIYKKIVKGIRAGDQVLFLTTSSQPYMASKQFVQLHDKFVMLPVADYGSLYLAYKRGLMSRHGIDRHIQVSALARITQGDTSLELAQKVVAESTPISRRMEFKRREFRIEEVFERWLVHPERLSKKQLDNLEKFRGKLPLESRRREMIEEEEQEQQQSKKGQPNKKNK